MPGELTNHPIPLSQGSQEVSLDPFTSPLSPIGAAARSWASWRHQTTSASVGMTALFVSGNITMPLMCGPVPWVPCPKQTETVPEARGPWKFECAFHLPPTGHSIEREKIPHLFSSFQQGHPVMGFVLQVTKKCYRSYDPVTADLCFEDVRISTHLIASPPKIAPSIR